jgi:LysR family nitrogen assimilation transcriptional regulator
MRTRQLECFIRVCELGSLTKAAQRLNIAQPALGLQLAALDREFGVRLLERSSSGTQPTAAGLLFLDEARAMLGRLTDLKRRLHEQAANEVLTITLGLTPSLIPLLASPLVERIAAVAPRVTLTFLEQLSGGLLERVQSGQLELALLYDVPESPLYTIEPQLREILYLVARPGMALDQTEPIPMRELGSVDFVLPSEGDLLRDTLDRALKTADVPFHAAHSINSMPAIKAIVERGLGYGFLPMAAIAAEVEAGTLVARRIDPPMLRTLYLLRAKTLREDGLLGLVIDVIREAVHQLRDEDPAYEPV